MMENPTLMSMPSTQANFSSSSPSSLLPLVNDGVDNSGIRFSFGKVLVALVSSIICLMTAGGNVLVLLSFRINKKLRTTNNYFLISLAIADSIIGFVSMPIFIVLFISEKWLLGPYVCDLWLSLDYTVSNASVASLLLISFDRYFSITRPLTYRVNRTTRKVAFFIALSWVISTLMWSPLILLWPYFHGGQRSIRDDECRVQFLSANRYITLATAFAAFYLPVTIICIVYFKIWMKTKKRQIEFRNLQAEQSGTLKKGSSGRDGSRRGSGEAGVPAAATTNNAAMTPVSSETNMATKGSLTKVAGQSSRGDDSSTVGNEEKEANNNLTATNNKSKFTKFFKHLVDTNEEDEDAEVAATNNNELSTTVSYDAITYRSSLIANETVARNKSSFDTTAIEKQQRHQHSRGLFACINRLCTEGRKKTNSSPPDNIIYSKSKFVYERSKSDQLVSNQCLFNNSNNNNNIIKKYKYSESSGRKLFRWFVRPVGHSPSNIKRTNNQQHRQTSQTGDDDDDDFKTTPQIKLCKFSDDDISFRASPSYGDLSIVAAVSSPRPLPILIKEFPPYSLKNNQINRLIEYKKCSCNVCVMNDSFTQIDDSPHERPIFKKKISFESNGFI